MFFYHVVSDVPKQVGQRFVLDEKHPNGVYERMYAQMNIVEDIYNNPEKYEELKDKNKPCICLRSETFSTIS